MVKIVQLARHDGQDIREAVLEDGDQAVHVMSWGAVTRDWRVSAGGRDIPIVLGFPNFADYPEHSRSFGIIAGRVANRTAWGQFSLDGTAYQLPINDTPNHLHGGIAGFGKRNWQMERDSAANAVRLFYQSQDGEEGYPGQLDVSVVIRLQGEELSYEMEAHADRRTPVNLAQHNYYNLNGQGDVRGHKLRVAALKYTPVDTTLIPTGEMLPVKATRLDFMKSREIGENDPGRAGFDLNAVLEPDRNMEEPAAHLCSEQSGLELSMITDQPGIQLFNAPSMEIAVPGHDGVYYGKFSGLCLEPQHFPNYLNEPGWPQSFAEPDHPYRQSLKLRLFKTGS